MGEGAWGAGSKESEQRGPVAMAAFSAPSRIAGVGSGTVDVEVDAVGLAGRKRGGTQGEIPETFEQATSEVLKVVVRSPTVSVHCRA